MKSVRGNKLAPRRDVLGMTAACSYRYIASVVSIEAGEACWHNFRRCNASVNDMRSRVNGIAGSSVREKVEAK